MSSEALTNSGAGGEDAVWRALSNPVRRQLLDRLVAGPMSTGELTTTQPDLSRFAVMQHLGVLEEAGLVLVRREGRRRLNYLNAVPVQQVCERWVQGLSGRSARAATAFKRHVESSTAPADPPTNPADPADQ